ncbi:MAG: tetratricopeptide repeat protein [Deltaproteobacteria bacterium]|jgi:tetratricopeptide (TPR) repeat protein|nr:tetratricopeptide repeat protein [Deltaproteobacteria bacterium]
MCRLIIYLFVLISLLVSSTAFSQGVAEYTEAIEQSPESMKYKFYFLRGLAYRDQRDVDAAIRDFSTSIKMRPTQDAYLRRGEMYFEKGSYKVAESDFSEAIEINPSVEAYKLRGLTNLVLGKLDMAIDDGTEIINKAPNTSESYNIRMEAYAQIGKMQLAREDARRALSLDRRNKVAAELLVNNPEKIEITRGSSRYRPKGDINKYRVWANNKGFAFTLKPEKE